MNNSSIEVDKLNPNPDIYMIFAPISIYSLQCVWFWFLLGTFGNILSFAIWTTPNIRKKNSSAIYLAAVSISDTALLILTVLIHRTSFFQRPVLCEAHCVPYMATQYCSPILVLAFTVERWISVCFPYQRDNFCTPRRACYVVLGVSCLTTSFSMANIYFFEFQNNTVCDVKPESGPEEAFRVYSLVIEILISVVVPLATLLFNGLVIKEIRTAIKCPAQVFATTSVNCTDESPECTGMMRKKTTSKKTASSSSRSSTVMLLSVSFYLIITTLPEGMMYSLQHLFPPGNDTMTTIQMSHDVTWQRRFTFVSIKSVIDQLALSHYACNFIIYFATGKIYRNRAKEMVTYHCQRSTRSKNSSSKKTELSYTLINR